MRYLVAVRPEQILKVLEVTDSFNIHREAVTIPLSTDKDGSVVVLPNGNLRIVCPEHSQFDEWLTELRRQLEGMDLSKIVKH